MSRPLPGGDAYPHRYLGFGLRWASQIALHAFPAEANGASTGPSAGPDVHVRVVEALETRAFDPPVPGSYVQAAADGFRYRAGDEATIDAYGDDRLEVLPEPAWRGELPAPFFATVTALLLARRGLIPLHGSAVQLEREVVLVCGPAGAGKSTLAAGLVAAGARLISDDLTILHPHPAGGVAAVFAGRRRLRLFADTAGWLGESVQWSAPPVWADRKLAVAPPQVEPLLPFPLRTLLILGGKESMGEKETEVEEAGKGPALAAQLFRPAWMRRMPGHALRLAALHLAARNMRVIRMPAVEVREAALFRSRGAQVLEKLLRKP